jgi:hypothetical protein
MKNQILSSANCGVGSAPVKDLPVFFTLADLIRMTRLSRQVITKDIKDGKLPSQRIGIQYCMTRSDLVVWLGSEQRVNDLLETYYHKVA